MNVNVANPTTYENAKYEGAKKAGSAGNGIKRFIARLARASAMDGDAIFKSKDWPYLWRK